MDCCIEAQRGVSVELLVAGQVQQMKADVLVPEGDHRDYAERRAALVVIAAMNKNDFAANVHATPEFVSVSHCNVFGQFAP